MISGEMKAARTIILCLPPLWAASIDSALLI
jgi:hypothetical protein